MLGARVEKSTAKCQGLGPQPGLAAVSLQPALGGRAGSRSTEPSEALPQRAPKPASRESGVVAARSGWGCRATRTPLTGNFQFPMELKCKSREAVTVCASLGEEKVTVAGSERLNCPFPNKIATKGAGVWRVVSEP